MAKTPQGETRETIERLLRLIDDPMLDHRSDAFTPYVKTLQRELGAFEDGVLGPELVHRIVALSDDEIKQILSGLESSETIQSVDEQPNRKPGSARPYADLPADVGEFLNNYRLQLLPDRKPPLNSVVADSIATHFTLQVTVDRDMVTDWIRGFGKLSLSKLTELELVIRDYRVLLPVYLADPLVTRGHSPELSKYSLDEAIPLLRIARHEDAGPDTLNLEVMVPNRDTPTEFALSTDNSQEFAGSLFDNHRELVFETDDVVAITETLGEDYPDIRLPELEEVKRAGYWKQKVAGWLGGTQRPAIGPGEISFSGYVSDDIDRADALGLERDVKAMCSIIASREVNPPLSIGLFGDWGTGKSFFIKEMRACISKMTAKAAAAEEELRQGGDVEEPDYWSNIAQINFNAWHFEDADLWASLVVHIFDSLSTYLAEGVTEVNEAVEKRKQLFRSLQAMQEDEREFTARAAEAQNREDRAREDLDQANANLEAARREANSFNMENVRRSVLQAMLEKRPEFRKLLDDLGITDLGKDAEQVRQQIVELKKESQSIGRELKVLAQKLLTPRGLLLLMGLVAASLLWPMLVAQIEVLKEDSVWRDVVELAGQVVAWGGGAIAAVQGWLTPVRKKIELAMNGFKQLEEESEKQVADEKTRALEARQNLDKRRLERKESELRLQQAIANRETVEQEIEDLKNGKLLFNFLKEKSSSTLYRDRLGLVTSIRRDFKRLSDILTEQANQKRARWQDSFSASNLNSGDIERDRFDIDRIVLYIDDLDRCTPERVIEVLRAIHLLLAFKLFVVVVAVDSRWLLNSIQQSLKNVHFGTTGLDKIGQNRSESLLTVEALRATPQNYLEKIFQIPFALRPISREGMSELLNQLAAPVAGGFDSADSPKERTGKDAKSPSEAMTGEVGAEEPESGEPRARTVKKAAPAEKTAPGEPVTGQSGGTQRPAGNMIDMEPYDNVELNVPDSHFYRHEVEQMEVAWTILQTPRSVNRFVNTYRILRSMVRPERRGEFFDENTGEYRAALFMLMVLIGYPKLSEAVFRALQDCNAANDIKAMESLPAQFAREQEKIELNIVLGLFHETYNALGQRMAPFSKWMAPVARFAFRPINIGFAARAED